MTESQGFPKLSAPFVNATGAVAQPWLQFLISLWNRTGAAQGGSIFSPGDLKGIAYETPPDGWVECNGEIVSRTAFATLFAAIGTTWGSGDGSTTFKLPDFRNKTLVGASTTRPFGSTGGSNTVTLSVPNLPPHTHVINDPGHLHSITDPGHHHTSIATASNAAAGAATVGQVAGVTGDSTTGITINSSTTGISIQNTGAGDPFSVMPPYAAIKWIIKT